MDVIAHVWKRNDADRVMTPPLVAVREIRVPLQRDVFRVELGLPRDPRGLVYLLRDNGNVVRGNALAFVLRENGLGTAICHLLTPAERERARLHRRVPIRPELLAQRLLTVVDAVSDELEIGTIAAGIAASGTAAAAALRVATLRPLAFDAIACRHARIDPARPLAYVHAPTLFLAVAGDLSEIRAMTRAFRQLQCTKHFELVQGESAAFTDEHSFAAACELTSSWMRKYVGRSHDQIVSPAPLHSKYDPSYKATS